MKRRRPSLALRASALAACALASSPSAALACFEGYGPRRLVNPEFARAFLHHYDGWLVTAHGVSLLVTAAAALGLGVWRARLLWARRADPDAALAPAHRRVLMVAFVVKWAACVLLFLFVAFGARERWSCDPMVRVVFDTAWSALVALGAAHLLTLLAEGLAFNRVYHYSWRVIGYLGWAVAAAGAWWVCAQFEYAEPTPEELERRMQIERQVEF